MNADSLDIRLLRFRSRRDEPAPLLAQALLDAGRHGEAIEVVQLGLLEAEDDPRLLVLEGRIWFEQGDLPLAQASLLRALKIHPHEKEGYRWLAQVLMKRGEPARAVQVLERALVLDPDDKTLQQARARAQRLSRIAHESDTGEFQVQSPSYARSPEGEVRPTPEPPKVRAPEPVRAPDPPARRSVEPARVEGPKKAPAFDLPPPPVFPPLQRPSHTPREPQKSVEPLPAVVTPRHAPPVNDVRPAPLPASAARSAQPMAARGNAAPDFPLHTELDTVPPTAGTQEALLAAFERDDEDEVLDGMHVDDAPTSAFEMPQEVQDWLESERRGQAAPVPGVRTDLANRPALEVLPDSLELKVPPRSGRSLEVEPRHRALEPRADLLKQDPPGMEPPRVEPPRMEPPRMEPPARVERREPERREPEPKPLRADQIEVAPSVESDIETEVFDAPNVGEPEPPEAVLDTLARQGLFEQGQAHEEAWVSKREAGKTGSRIGRNLAVTWLLALAAAGGGYYGYTRYAQARKSDAKTLIAQAVADARDGQYESLLAAERRLRAAHEKDPKSREASEILLFVHATRALEDAGGDLGYLRASVAHAEQAKVSPALIAAGKALLAAADRNVPVMQSEADRALALAGGDARALYLVGRLDQRSGKPEARAILEQATQKDAALSLAWLAQAEIARQEGEVDKARELLARSLGDDKAQLRAELWTVVLSTGTTPPAELEATLKKLAPRVERGAASDKLLFGIAEASVLLVKGDVEGARARVKETAKLNVQDPELMSLLGERAASVGEHELAYRAANAAMVSAPTVRRYRDALARVLLKRGDGRAVLAALDGIDDPGAWLLVTRARAALLTGSREALDNSKKALSAYRAGDEPNDSEVSALLVRTDLKLGANPEALLSAARSIVQKAPNSAMAQLALGEVALAAGQGELALSALDKAKKLAPEEADVFALRGRALRLVGKPDQAEESFVQALALSPSHAAARESLGSLLLDRGDYDRALQLFSAAKRERGGLSASFGLMEAYLGSGELAEAQKEIESLDEEARARPMAQVMSARIALEKHKPGDAVKLLEPLVDDDAETRTADLLALYGDALYANDKVDSAAGAYEDALELDSTQPDALVGRAMAAVRAEKVSQAEELLQQARVALETRVRPPKVRANLLLAMGKVDILKQNYARAKETLAEAISLPGAPTETHFWYAETLAKTKSGGAQESYSRYLELDPGGYYAGRAKKALAPR